MDEQRFKFLLAEYQEASRAFVAGAQIAQSVFQSFLVGNGVLAALFGAAAGLSRDSIATAKYVLPIIPLVGILSTFLLVLMAPRYRHYADEFRKRCMEIEAELGGRLFSSLEPSTRGGKIRPSIVSIRLIGAVFILFWLCVFVSAILVIEGTR